jgi:abortive infection bacteriophage resistance protein
MKFLKPAATIDEQLDILISRGLTIQNYKKAHQVLSEVNYYRLSAYYLPFQKDKKQHLFYSNATFEKIVRLYQFDKALRNIVMPVVESAEVLARMRITYHLVTKYKDFAKRSKEEKEKGRALVRE